MPAAWLAAAVRRTPSRFPAAVAAGALPQARLEADASPAFPACEVVACEDEDGEVLRLGLPGLRGSASPLPTAWTVALAGLARESPAAGLVAAIEHRVLEQAVAVQRRRPVDRAEDFASLLAALAGLAPGLPPALAGVLAEGATAAGLAAALADAAGARVRVEAACGGRLPLGGGARPLLGGACRLGLDLPLGEAASGPDLGFRVIVGPVPWSDAARLRPGGASGRALLAVLARLAPPTCGWEAVLLIDPAGSPRPPLGLAPLGSAARLAGDAVAIERELIARSPTG